MKLETKPIIEPVKGKEKLTGLAVAAIHNGKVVMWRVRTFDAKEIDRVKTVVQTINKMIETFHIPNEPIVKKKVKSKKNGENS